MAGRNKRPKCPPGVAEGAGDLQRWASRRMGGKSGVNPTKRERERWKASQPKDEADRWLARHLAFR